MLNLEIFGKPRVLLPAAKRALILVTAAAALGLLGASLAIAAPPQAADCAGIKQVIQTSGRYLYHYRDPKHPTLPLYTLYVRRDSQCNVGDALEEKTVPSMDGCVIPTCVEQDTYGER